MTKKLTFLVEITEAVEAFVTGHGAYFDKRLQRWVVEGEVPPELESYVEKVRRARDFVAEKAPQCELCGCQMLLRNSTYGDFWGCSAFPRCKGKRSITAVEVDYGDSAAKNVYLYVGENNAEDEEDQDEPVSFSSDAEKPVPPTPEVDDEQLLEASSDDICKQIVDSHFKNTHASDIQKNSPQTSVGLSARADEVRKLAVEKLGPRQAKSWLEGPKVTLKGGRPADLLKTLAGCDQAESMLNDLYS